MKKNKIIIVLSIIAVCLVCAGSGFYIWYLNSPFTTVVKMKNAMKEKDMDALIECIEPETAGQLQMMTELFGVSADDLMGMMSERSEGGFDGKGYGFGGIGSGKGSMKFPEYSRDGNQAVIKFTTEDENGSTQTQEIQFVRIDGTWYLVFDFMGRR